MKKFKQPLFAVVGYEEGEVCLFGFHDDMDEAYEHRDRLVSERSDLVRRTMETTARTIKKPLVERNVNAVQTAVDQSYTVVELSLGSPNKQVIWSFE